MSDLPPATPHAGCVTELVQVMFDNIQRGQYYYVHSRDDEDSDYDYDYLAHVTNHSTNPDSNYVTFRISHRRRNNMYGGGIGAWQERTDEFTYGPNDVNSDEQENCVRFYLPA